MSTPDERYEQALSDLSTARLVDSAKLFSWEHDGRDMLAIQIAEFTLKLARMELGDCLVPRYEPEPCDAGKAVSSRISEALAMLRSDTREAAEWLKARIERDRYAVEQDEDERCEFHRSGGQGHCNYCERDE